MLSTAAFNALLKTLEEPPPHVVFVLATTHPHKVPETIQSRCQRFDFHRIGIDDIVGRLRVICDGEGFDVDDAALALIARHAAGGMRDAITTLEQLASFTGGTITLDDVEGLLGEVDAAQLLRDRRAGRPPRHRRLLPLGRALRRGGHRPRRVRARADRPRAQPLRDRGRRRRPRHRRRFRRGPRAARSASPPSSAGRTGSRACSTCSASSERRCAGAATRGSRSRWRSRAWRAREGEMTLEALAERVEALEAGHARPASSASASRAAPLGAAPAAPRLDSASAAHESRSQHLRRPRADSAHRTQHR